jgi:hypothetical protein
MQKTITLILASAVALVSTNCSTTYDAYGNPRQSVDPGTAVAGAAAVGVLGYAIANNRDNDNNRNYHYDNRSRGRSYYGRNRRY